MKLSKNFWKKRERDLIKLFNVRYELLSDIGVDGLKRFIEICEKRKKKIGHHDYYESTKEWFVEWFSEDNKEMRKIINKIKKIKWGTS